MHVELADQLRCPELHADSWLVVAADRTEHRVVLDGMLGCPTCGAEYPIVRGVVQFGAPPRAMISSPVANVPEPADDDAMRAAALLNATNASARIAFVGASLALPNAMQQVVPARCVVINAPDADHAESFLVGAHAPMSVVHATMARVLAAGAFDGVWVAEGSAAEWATAIRPRGRLVSPIEQPLPRGFTELARDAAVWVAERSAETETAPASLVQLRRRR